MRGRGRGRRGGRGRGRGGRHNRSRGNTRPTTSDTTETETSTVYVDLSVEGDVKPYFVGNNATIDQHYEAQDKNRDRYAATMAVLTKNGVEISQNSKIRALAAAWSRQDRDLANSFLENDEYFGLVEILKAVSLLDSGRQIRVLERKMKRLQTSTGKVLPKTIGKLKCDIDNLNKIKPQHGSASGAVCKHIREWVRRFDEKKLEFYALHFPLDSWKKLADICHFHPKKDFPSCEWFLPYCHGAPAPADSMVDRCRTLTVDNVNSLLVEFPIPYAHLKDHVESLTEDSKARIAASEPKLDTVLWYYENLKCSAADQVILKRVERGDPINLPNGKLLDRLLLCKIYRENINSGGIWRVEQHLEPEKRTADETKAPFFKHMLPLVQAKIDKISLKLESPIVVVGDASGSMSVAVQTSSIISGLLTALTSAKLVFFNNENRYAPYLPKNVEEVLQLAVDTVAYGGTAPAASLWPFYDKKEVVKTFIIVTDEEENQGYQKFTFAQLYKKYHDEVYPAKLVFVSFLLHQHDKGQMVAALQALGFDPKQFVFNRFQPDLTKLDKLLGLLSSETSSFEDELKEMESKIKQVGLHKSFQGLNV